jgi:hypothetical protein
LAARTSGRNAAAATMSSEVDLIVVTQDKSG